MPRRAKRPSALACSASDIREVFATLQSPGDELVERLRLWSQLLEKWSKAQRLVGWRRPEGLLHEGLLDAWAAVPLLAESDPRPLIDLGSGSGLPAIVLAAAYPSREMHLVEVRRKRASFLMASVRRLGLEQVKVHQARLEELAGKGLLPKGAVVTARAFAPPQQVLIQAAKLDAARALLSIARDSSLASWSAPWTEMGQRPGSPSDRRLHVLLKR